MRPKNIRLFRLAERQHTVFTRAQAVALGFTPNEVDGHLARGLWERVHRGVYRLGGSRITFEGQAMAAVLACGAEAAASHNTAGQLWKLEGVVGMPLEVTTPRGRRSRIEGIVVHEPRHLPRTDVATMDSIPITTPSRTIIDLAGCLGEPQLEDALDDARRRDLVHAAPLLARVRVERRQGRRGLTVLERLLLERIGKSTSGSGKENLVQRFFRSAGLPPAVAQHVIREADGTFVARVDFAYPSAKLAIEFDGYEKHSSRRQWESDRVRQNRLVAVGWFPLRITDRQLRDVPDDIVEAIWRHLWANRPVK